MNSYLHYHMKVYNYHHLYRFYTKRMLHINTNINFIPYLIYDMILNFYLQHFNMYYFMCNVFTLHHNKTNNMDIY